MGAHAQLFRDALHALSLGAAAFALFGDGEMRVRIAYMCMAVVLHALAHVVIAANRYLKAMEASDE